LTGARRKEVDDDGGAEGGVCREGGKEEVVEERSLLARWKERERGRDGWESTVALRKEASTGSASRRASALI
jgi:hypothetical protein